MSETYREPETREEWQDAADIAHACLCLHAAKPYGVIIAGPGVNVDRCSDLLARAADQGIWPRSDSFDRWSELIQEHAREEGKA